MASVRERLLNRQRYGGLPSRQIEILAGLGADDPAKATPELIQRSGRMLRAERAADRLDVYRRNAPGLAAQVSHDRAAARAAHNDASEVRQRLTDLATIGASPTRGLVATDERGLSMERPTTRSTAGGAVSVRRPVGALTGGGPARRGFDANSTYETVATPESLRLGNRLEAAGQRARTAQGRVGRYQRLVDLVDAGRERQPNQPGPAAGAEAQTVAQRILTGGGTPARVRGRQLMSDTMAAGDRRRGLTTAPLSGPTVPGVGSTGAPPAPTAAVLPGSAAQLAIDQQLQALHQQAGAGGAPAASDAVADPLDSIRQRLGDPTLKPSELRDLSSAIKSLTPDRAKVTPGQKTRIDAIVGQLRAGGLTQAEREALQQQLEKVLSQIDAGPSGNAGGPAVKPGGAVDALRKRMGAGPAG